MRASEYLLATQRETPTDAQIVSHQLMLRAGMIRKLASGLYTWLPIGLRVLRKVEAIVREEMDSAGAQELLMPVIQPAELWEETGRWDQYGPMLLKMKDRSERQFCFGPTHEEIITDLFRFEISSYKQLPCCFYQIQTKFRDEIRPRFGVMRAREFLMKDAYSFDIDEVSLKKTYQSMYEAYSKIFTRLNLEFRSVLADSGEIGGNLSHEFHVIADSGEDALAISDGSDYAANVERAETIPSKERAKPNGEPEELLTPHAKSIEAQATELKVEPKDILKTLLVEGEEEPVVALVLRGDHTLNEIKAVKHPKVKSPLRLVSDQEVLDVAKCAPGFVSPKDLSIPVIADFAAAQMDNFICGANKTDYHIGNMNWGRDLAEPELADLRNAEAGDPSPDGKGTLFIKRGIEVGHIFHLGDKYSKSMNATVLDENGKARMPQMGCYGIGISRIVAAAIEQNHDDYGIIWTDALAPFHIAIVPINHHKSESVRKTAEELYAQLTEAGFDVLLDDRKERPGVKFSDMDLIGIPHRIVIGDKSLDNNEVEYKHRREKETKNIKLEEVVAFFRCQAQV